MERGETWTRRVGRGCRKEKEDATCIRREGQHGREITDSAESARDFFRSTSKQKVIDWDKNLFQKTTHPLADEEKAVE